MSEDLNHISVFSTKTKDRLITPNGVQLISYVGGPITFIEQALKKLNISYQAKSGDMAEIEIAIYPDHEVGRVKKLSGRQIPNAINLSPWVIVSTVLQEWDISHLKVPKLFIDIQGYVRKGEKFGEKALWEEALAFPNSFYCLKGTEEEVRYLPQKILNRQKQKMLVITRGPLPVRLYYQGKLQEFPIFPEIKLKDTIGAGDTFFGYFVGHQFLGDGPEMAIAKSIRETIGFLKEKKL